MADPKTGIGKWLSKALTNGSGSLKVGSSGISNFVGDMVSQSARVATKPFRMIANTGVAKVAGIGGALVAGGILLSGYLGSKAKATEERLANEPVMVPSDFTPSFGPQQTAETMMGLQPVAGDWAGRVRGDAAPTRFPGVPDVAASSRVEAVEQSRMGPDGIHSVG